MWEAGESGRKAVISARVLDVVEGLVKVLRGQDCRRILLIGPKETKGP